MLSASASQLPASLTEFRLIIPGASRVAPFYTGMGREICQVLTGEWRAMSARKRSHTGELSNLRGYIVVV